MKVRHRFPLPGHWTPDNPPKGFSMFSSFGCPEPCTFCCSPKLTGRRWKAIPGKQLAEEVAELQQRFGFDVLRFQDANFGVAEKRTKEFCEELVNLGVPIHWNGTIEIETIMRYKESTLDLLEESKCHLLWLGAETGTKDMQERIKKHIGIDHIPIAVGELVKRNIVPGTFWIIGYPGETRESMEQTLKIAAEIKHRYPIAGSEVYPFRPIPGTEDFATRSSSATRRRSPSRSGAAASSTSTTARTRSSPRRAPRGSATTSPRPSTTCVQRLPLDAQAAVEDRRRAPQARGLRLPHRAEAVRPLRAHDGQTRDHVSQEYAQLQPETHARLVEEHGASA